jgi:hypothetical protein
MTQANCYAISSRSHHCFLSGIRDYFEWPNGVIKIKHKNNWNGPCDTYGCGLLLSPTNKLAIFFTVNGILMGQFNNEKLDKITIPYVMILQVSKFQSILLGIASSQLFA